ncbi:hypothetical protein SLEP1_g54242 [Rubroshorea leprosula]|uniref:Uncharacterized protein n=1 Tax=Rubroshorea leprosula TaxID=152421 RepID=A0AAV5MER8_9ROSI|nr:hypothetical protein SLEP1_g54242 [Rubroshorea leprosula]
MGFGEVMKEVDDSRHDLVFKDTRPQFSAKGNKGNGDVTEIQAASNTMWGGAKPNAQPSTSPVVHFLRRKSTLRMLLTRTTSRRGVPNQDCFVATSPSEKKKKKNDDRDTKGRTLKDLLVSSPSPCGEDEDKSKVFNGKTGGRSEVLPDNSKGLDVGSGSPRTGWVGIRAQAASEEGLASDGCVHS